ncbi:hypothetical protein [Fulvivirga ligni]|uniref:hypothetical protein n=1 Tax=Fulvivirga ligni TaxID=2904246 RepID=UPI001F3E55F1|nr:hypothetical protein [Fulvivirga ligni]UII22599.1 hypothetical protein LVD16_05085 [Fulvivirga ligni]
MRSYQLILCSLILFINCTEADKKKPRTKEIEAEQEKLEPGNNKISALKSPDNNLLTDSIAELYSGFWLNEDFLQQVEQNKSIYRSTEFQGVLFGFTLDKKDLLTGKAGINGFTVHEGGLGAPIAWHDKLHCFTTSGEVDEQSSLPKAMDLILSETNQIEFQFETGDSYFYRKVESEITELRKILFAGSYTDIKDYNYLFQEDGRISGFNNFSKYSVLYDFGEGLYFDTIILTNDQNNEELLYHYRISNDTLRLYEITGELPQYAIGELKFELVKE